MSKAVKSDGTVNQAVFDLCRRGLANYERGEIDKALSDDNLKKCRYATLLLAGLSYVEAFGEECWRIQVRLEAVAWQSAHYREFTRRSAPSRARDHGTDGDPMRDLLGGEAAPGADAEE